MPPVRPLHGLVRCSPSPVCRGEQAGENDGFGVGDQFDPGLGRTGGSAEKVFAQHVESTVPAPTKRFTTPFPGEQPGQAVAGGKRGGEIGTPADDPVVPEVGPPDLGQPYQIVLIITEEPAVVPVADPLVVRGAADDESVNVTTGHAETAGGAPAGLDQFFDDQPLAVLSGFAHLGRDRHRMDQRRDASAGQGSQQGQAAGVQ